MIFASSFSGFGSIATAIILEFKYLTKKVRKNYHFVYFESYNFREVELHLVALPASFLTSWPVSSSSWRSLYTIPTTNETKKNRKIKKAEAQSFKKLQITQSIYRLCKETNKLRTLNLWVENKKRLIDKWEKVFQRESQPMSGTDICAQVKYRLVQNDQLFS